MKTNWLIQHMVLFLTTMNPVNCCLFSQRRRKASYTFMFCLVPTNSFPHTYAIPLHSLCAFYDMYCMKRTRSSCGLFSSFRSFAPCSLSHSLTRSVYSSLCVCLCNVRTVPCIDIQSKHLNVIF